MRVVFDASGNVLGRMDYAPFGEELYTGLFLPSERFAQLARDGEAGQDYAEARMYQPRSGRFSSPDPVFAGLLHPQAWNRYTYSNANPIRFSDPTGLCYDGLPCFRSGTVATLPTDTPVDSSAAFDLLGGNGVAGYDAMLPLHDESEYLGGGGQFGSSPSPPPPPSPPAPPPSEGDRSSCEQFTENIAGFITRSTGGFIDRVGKLPFRAAKMGQMVINKEFFGTRIPIRAPGTSGFRVELVDHGQNEDVYKHVIFNAGGCPGSC